MTPLTPRSAWAFATYRTRRARHRVERACWDPVRDLWDPERTRCLPADPDRLEGYADRFTDTARLFQPFLRRSGHLVSATAGRHVGIVVTPWFGTPAPWYSIALGLGLARRGRRVTFVWHDLPFTEPKRRFRIQHDEIGRALRSLDRRFPVVRTSRAARSPARAGDDTLVDDLASQNLVWTTRAAPELEPDEAHLAEDLRSRLAIALPHVRTVVQQHGFDVVVVPGGVLNTSGLYLAAAREAGTRGATFDGGVGWVITGTQGVAAQQTDLARAFTMLTDEPGSDDAIVTAAREAFDLRRLGEDATSYQHPTAPDGAVTTSAASTGPHVLVPLSVMFDTAALGRHHLFGDSREWLVETVRVLLGATTDPIVVRQHPSERRPEERSRFDPGRILADAFGTDPQVRFVPGDDPTNTYELLAHSRLVVPFVSTIGIEAAALGTPVVVGGAVYYADLGFVRAPTTIAEYTELLARGARGELAELPRQRELAWRCYYVNAVCQRVFTEFSAQPPDYWRWVRRPPEDLFADPDVDDILTALDDDVPLPIVRHRRLLGGATHHAAGAGPI